jgi:hypothetical protein
VLVEFQARASRVSQVEDLHLPDHLRRAGGGEESAARERQARHVGGPGHHGRLFDNHRHEHVPPVDAEILRDAQRQAEHADHILDHVVGMLRSQSAESAESAYILGVYPGLPGDQLAPLVQAQIIKFRRLVSLFRHDLSSLYAPYTNNILQKKGGLKRHQADITLAACKSYQVGRDSRSVDQGRS